MPEIPGTPYLLFRPWVIEIALCVSRLRQLQGILYRAAINLVVLLDLRLSPSSEEKN
jgi:hypothetical protein